MTFSSRLAPRFRIAAAFVFLPLFLLPGVVAASSHHRPAAGASLKLLGLRLSDVQRVFGSGLTATVASNKTSKDITCANAPTVESAIGFSTSNGAPLRRNGLLSINAVISQYKSSAGPICNFKYDLFQRKTLGTTLGVVTKLSGIGDQAVLIRLDPNKHDTGSPVYTLDVRFIRGHYVSLVIVQMNRKVRPADVIKLAQAVDNRIKHSG